MKESVSDIIHYTAMLPLQSGSEQDRQMVSREHFSSGLPEAGA